MKVAEQLTELRGLTAEDLRAKATDLDDQIFRVRLQLSMGLAMAWLLFTHNPHVTATVEAGHLLMLTLMMPAVAVLAERLRQMRRRLHAS